MIFINKLINNKDILTKTILIFFFIASWFSIGTSFNNLKFIFFNEKITILGIIDAIRVLINLAGFPILLFLFTKQLFKTKDDIIKSNWLFFVFFSYFLSQIPGLFYTDNSISNVVYILSAINILMIVSLSVQIFRPNELAWLFYISAFLLLVVLSQAFTRDMISFIYTPNTRFYGQVNQLIIEGHIRSSGASRIALLLLIGYSIFIKDSIKPKYIQFIPILFLSTIIFLYQSRTVIILLFLFILFYLLFIENWSFKGLLKYLVICFLIPYLASSYASIIKLQYDLTDKMKRDYQQQVTDKGYEGTLDDFEKENKKIYILSEDNAICKIIKCKSNQRIVTTKATSGRLSDWKDIFNNFDFNNNLFFGYGSQGDRYLINQTASNGILYALSSSGIVGLIIFIIFSFIAVIKIFKYFLFNDKKNAIYSFSILIIIVIGVRSLIESSYALFGIDFIIFYICLAIVTKFDKISKQ